MLLVLVKVKRMLELSTETLAIGRLAMSSMLLLVDVPCTTTLFYCKLLSEQEMFTKRTPVWNSS